MNRIKISSKYILLLTLFLLSSACADSDDTSGFLGEVAWIKTFGGSEEDVAIAVIEANDSTYMVLGTTSSTDGDVTDKATVENDFWLLKIDGDGNTIWSKTYGGSDDDVAQSVIQTTDGGYAIIGYSKSSDGDASNNEGFHDNWIIKLDVQGNIQWENSFGFAGHDHAYDVLQTTDGGYFLSGFMDVTASGGEGNSGKAAKALHGFGEFWAVKTDASGVLQWSRYFGGSNNDRSYSVVQANDGGFVLTGFSESNDFNITDSKGSYDFWVIKITAAGELAWERSFGGSGIEEAYSIALTEDNNYIIAGQTYSTDKDVTEQYGNADFWVIKIDDDGQLLWDKNYGGTDFDSVRSITPTRDGGFVMAGNTKSTTIDVSENFGENDIWAVKINASGKLQWEMAFGGFGIDFGHDAIETSDRNIIIVGETESNDHHITENKGKKDMVIIKLR
ncbi:MAG: hypothetical protein AAF934_00475 [Bacteroidota bacterium]